MEFGPTMSCGVLLVLIALLGGGVGAQECPNPRASGDFCGSPRLTEGQQLEIEANRDIVNRIEEMGVPIYEGSPEALELGLSADNLIVTMTEEQQNFYRRCFPDSPDETPIAGGTRRKRQADNNDFCCPPDPEPVRLLATVNPSGRAVQIANEGAMFDGSRNCQGNNRCGSVDCRPRRVRTQATVPVIEVGSGMTSRTRMEFIMIDLCAAAP